MHSQYKITAEPHPADCSVTLMLNGKFSEDSLPELDHSITEARGANCRVYIDLSEVKLVNCPIYLRRWIGQVSDEVEN